MDKRPKSSKSKRTKSTDIIEEVPVELGQLETAAFYKIPVEIWEIFLLQHVRPGKDMYAAYNSWSTWKNILEPKKTEWMFPQIFPSLFEYLPKQDILGCRLVSKRWCQGVDAFFENNPIVRRSSGEDEMEVSNKVDMNHSKLQHVYLKKAPRFESLSLARREAILEEAKGHTRNPFIGRSIEIAYHPNPDVYGPSKRRIERACKIGKKVLEQFSQHIYFLKVYFHHYSSVDLFTTFVEMFTLYDLTNLKSLTIYDNHGTNPEFQETDDVSRQLGDYPDNLTEDQISHFPKYLESLKFGLARHGECGITLRLIFSYLFAKNLKGFSNMQMPFLCCFINRFENVCDLSFILDTNIALEIIYHLEAPIRRLKLLVSNREVIRPRLIEAINRFRNTLHYLALQFRMFRYETSEPFSSENDLDLPNIKTLEFIELPPSLNFIGLLSSLQYLHIKCDGWFQGRTQSYLKETLDIVHHLENSYSKADNSLGRPNMHQSNIWKVFKRLNMFTLEVAVHYPKPFKYWEYRRNLF